jgi:hypothetical protein
MFYWQFNQENSRNRSTCNSCGIQGHKAVDYRKIVGKTKPKPFKSFPKGDVSQIGKYDGKDPC